MASYKIKKHREPKTFTYQFSLSGLISLGGGLVLALTFFFILGILIGRGYRPEADVPELAAIMPQQSMHENAIDAQPEGPGVLPLEELQYPEQLAERPEAEPAAEEPAETEQPAAEAAQPAAPEAAAETPPEPEPAPAAEQTGPQFAYVYQCASFKRLEMAEALRDKLTEAGLDASVESRTVDGTDWHRVMVAWQGTPQSTDQLRATLAEAGLGRPMLVSKDPI